MIQKQKPGQYYGFTWQELWFCFSLIWIWKIIPLLCTFQIKVSDTARGKKIKLEWCCQLQSYTTAWIFICFTACKQISWKRLQEENIFPVAFTFFFFNQVPGFLRTGRIECYFFSHFCLDVLYTIHQLSSLGRKVGKKAWNPEWLRQAAGNGCTELEGRELFVWWSLWTQLGWDSMSRAVLSLRPRVCSCGTEGQTLRAGRGHIPHRVWGVCWPPTMLTVFLLLPWILSVTALQP